MTKTTIIYSRRDIEEIVNERVMKELKPLLKEIERMKINIIDILQLKR